MLCPHCGEEQNMVVQTNQKKEAGVTLGVIQRVRQCRRCGFSWTTEETALPAYQKDNTNERRL